MCGMLKWQVEHALNKVLEYEEEAGIQGDDETPWAKEARWVDKLMNMEDKRFQQFTNDSETIALAADTGAEAEIALTELGSQIKKSEVAIIASALTEKPVQQRIAKLQKQKRTREQAQAEQCREDTEEEEPEEATPTEETTSRDHTRARERNKQRQERLESLKRMNSVKWKNNYTLMGLETFHEEFLAETQGASTDIDEDTISEMYRENVPDGIKTDLQTEEAQRQVKKAFKGTHREDRIDSMMKTLRTQATKALKNMQPTPPRTPSFLQPPSPLRKQNSRQEDESDTSNSDSSDDSEEEEDEDNNDKRTSPSKSGHQQHRQERHLDDYPNPYMQRSGSQRHSSHRHTSGGRRRRDESDHDSYYSSDSGHRQGRSHSRRGGWSSGSSKQGSAGILGYGGTIEHRGLKDKRDWDSLQKDIPSLEGRHGTSPGIVAEWIYSACQRVQANSSQKNTGLTYWIVCSKYATDLTKLTEKIQEDGAASNISQLIETKGKLAQILHIDMTAKQWTDGGMCADDMSFTDLMKALVKTEGSASTDTWKDIHKTRLKKIKWEPDFEDGPYSIAGLLNFHSKFNIAVETTPAAISVKECVKIYVQNIPDLISRSLTEGNYLIPLRKKGMERVLAFSKLKDHVQEQFRKHKDVLNLMQGSTSLARKTRSLGSRGPRGGDEECDGEYDASNLVEEQIIITYVGTKLCGDCGATNHESGACWHMESLNSNIPFELRFVNGCWDAIETLHAVGAGSELEALLKDKTEMVVSIKDPTGPKIEHKLNTGQVQAAMQKLKHIQKCSNPKCAYHNNTRIRNRTKIWEGVEGECSAYVGLQQVIKPFSTGLQGMQTLNAISCKNLNRHMHKVAQTYEEHVEQ